MPLRIGETKSLGSPPLWICTRFLLPLIWLPSMVYGGSILARLVFAAGIFATPWVFYTDPVGFADEKGITFRRFIKKHHVAWNDVASIEWNPNGWTRGHFFIRLERPVGLGTQSLKFVVLRPRSMRPPEDPTVEVPDIVLWIANQIKLNEAFIAPE